MVQSNSFGKEKKERDDIRIILWVVFFLLYTRQVSGNIENNLYHKLEWKGMVQKITK